MLRVARFAMHRDKRRNKTVNFFNKLFVVCFHKHLKGNLKCLFSENLIENHCRLFSYIAE